MLTSIKKISSHKWNICMKRGILCDKN